MRRRILYVSNDGFYFVQHRAHLARRMAAEGWEVHVATGGDAGLLDDGFEVHPLDVDRLSFTLSRDLRLIGHIRALVRRVRPDVVHLITMKPIVFGAAALLSLSRRDQPGRIVATFPGLGRAFEATGLRARAARRLVLSVLRRLFARLPAAATFENDADRQTLAAAGVPLAGRAIVMRGAGLDLHRFSAGQHRDTGPFRVLWASRLIRGKGLDPFVGAARLAAADPSCPAEFLVAGYVDPGHRDGLADEELKSLESEPSVTFLGKVTDMPDLLRNVDAFVLPSRYNEGMPRALIEAAAAGLPAIASDNAGCRAIVEDGVTGTILKEVSAQEIWRAVRAYAADRGLAQRHGSAGAAFVRTAGFSEEAVQDAFIAVYAAGPRDQPARAPGLGWKTTD